MKRRDFLRSTAVMSTSLLLPKFLTASGLKRALLPRTNGRILVVVQLSGGNDGLNMLVPHGDDLYYKARPGIGLKGDEILKLNQYMAVNAEMPGLKNLYDEGHLAVLNSVGYPNPNRSHFRSMDIWHTGSSGNESLQTGWIGRYLDSQCCDGNLNHEAIAVDDALHLALKGSKLSGLAMKNPDQLMRLLRDKSLEAPIGDVADGHLDFMYKMLGETKNSADKIQEQVKAFNSKTTYPFQQFGKDMKTVAELIVSGLESSIYYVSLSGFDTHAFQKGPHNRSLKLLSGGLESFVGDMKSHNRFKDVCILVFSEFGRRLKQNASAGTDHGKGNCALLISGALKNKGIINGPPNLADLDQGDLKFTLDYRSIYATLLSDWLGQDDHKILSQSFEKIAVF